MNRTIRSLHLWLSLPFCLIIFAVCLSGAILVFESEITALIAPQEAERLPFFAFMSQLHKWLLHPRPDSPDAIWWGQIIVGISILAFVVILLTGLWLWWPAKRLRIAPTRSRRFIFDLHNTLGFLSTIFLLIMALTGLTWSFAWFQLPLSHSTIAALHFGNYWGLFSRCLHLVAALIGASLPITGLILYIRRLKK